VVVRQRPAYSVATTRIHEHLPPTCKQITLPSWFRDKRTELRRSLVSAKGANGCCASLCGLRPGLATKVWLARWFQTSLGNFFRSTEPKQPKIAQNPPTQVVSDRIFSLLFNEAPSALRSKPSFCPNLRSNERCCEPWLRHVSYRLICSSSRQKLGKSVEF
jgi:hypothetical protein